MDTYSIIIQGEGKGHFSQAMELSSVLRNKGDIIKRVYLGKSFFRKTPSYFKEISDFPVITFYSPNFIPSGNRKGIRILLSLLLNTLFIPLYLTEACRIGIYMKFDKSGKVLNFFDPLGALAAIWWKKKAECIAISHHFYLSHPDFIHPHGMGNYYFFLQFLNHFMMRSSDRVLALSFRKGKKYKKIEVVPPLIDHRIRNSIFHSGESDLCYFLNPGFMHDLKALYRGMPDKVVDVFTEDTNMGDLPENMRLHKPSRDSFIHAMTQCRRIITTSGFDLAAEAFYLGIPVFTLPSESHYEQYCNALDAVRTGMAFQLEELYELKEADFEPEQNAGYKNWVDTFRW